MPSRRSIAATALAAMLLFPGGLAAQSIEISFPGIDVPAISIDISGVPDAADISAGVEAAAQYNESDFDFVSRIAEEATDGISENVDAALAAVADRLEEFVQGGLDPEEIDSVVDELASIVVLCTSGDSCVPPDPPPPPPEP